MLRNDLITMLSDHDNDVVFVRVGALLVQVEAVTDDGGSLVVVLEPEELENALAMGAAATRQYGDLTMHRTHAPSMTTHQLSEILAKYRDNDAVVDFGGRLVAVCGADYYSSADSIVIEMSPLAAKAALANLIDDAIAEKTVGSNNLTE